MRLIDSLLKRFGYVKHKATRSYAFGAQTRLTADWIISGASADKEIYGDIVAMRQRARELERNNDYVRRYLKLVENNVLGAAGIGLQMKVTEPARQGGKYVEQYDEVANRLIEEAWWRNGQRENCTISGLLSWRDLQGLVLRSVVRDGAILLRKHRRPPFGLKLEPLEIDYLDTSYFVQRSSRTNEVRLGIEYDGAGIVQAYYIWDHHPGDVMNLAPTNRIRVPASDMYHVYMPERVGQSTGVPWMHSSGARLKHLDAFTEAAIVAARAGATKIAFLKRNGSEQYLGDGTDSSGNRVMTMEPGSIEELPPGIDPVFFDPSYPNTQYGEFVKSCLRGIAAGLGVSYVSLANDLESVNYSSIRAGLLEEREEWKSIQRWFIDWFVTPYFSEWLQSALALGAITDGNVVLPPGKFTKFNSPEWKPRRWPWVDPLKDIQASAMSVEKGFASRRQIVAENGGDIQETFRELEADKQLAAQHGLSFDGTQAGALTDGQEKDE